MQTQDLGQFIVENKQIIVPVVYVLGMFLKKTPKVLDWFIPWILLAVCIGLSLGIDASATGPINFAVSIMQGILCAGEAVLVNQLIKQTKNK